MPLLFLVIAGIVDFGRAFFFEIQLANSAREGVRAAVVLPSPPNPAASVTASVAARATAAAPIVSAANVTPVAICGTGSTAAATVDVQVPFEWIIMRPAIALVGGNWGLNGTLTSRAVMQCGG